MNPLTIARDISAARNLLAEARWTASYNRSTARDTASALDFNRLAASLLDVDRALAGLLDANRALLEGSR